MHYRNSHPSFLSFFFFPLHTRTDLGAMCSRKFNWPLIVNIIHQASNGRELLMCATNAV